MKATFLGHACWEVEANGQTLIFDPFVNDNPSNPRDVDDLDCDYILITHGHFDHIGDAKAIAETTGAHVITSPEVLQSLGEDIKGTGMNIGGTVDFDFGSVRMVKAFHSGGVPGSAVTGLVVESGGKTFYHPGDTDVYSDMKLLDGVLYDRIDLAVLPIGSHFTMDEKGAAIAADFIHPRKVVPMHYNTWPPIEADPQVFKQQVEERASDIEVVILEPGESTDV